MKLTKGIVAALLAAVMTIGSFASVGASNIYNETESTYTWSSNGEKKITTAGGSVTDGQLQINIAGTSDGIYGTDGRLVWWNGVNENGTSNNRKLVFKPKKSGDVKMKVGKIVSGSKYSADIVVNDGSSNIKEKNITAYKSDFTSTEDVTFDVEQGKSYTIYPEKMSNNSTGAYITSFVFTAVNEPTTAPTAEPTPTAEPASVSDGDKDDSKEENKKMEIYAMRTDDLENPLGIDNIHPKFSWKLKSDERGAKQENYKITVASDEEFKNVVWDSGTVSSDKSANIIYDGKELKASSRYYWHVEIADSSNKITTSDAAYFETGLMGTDASVWKDAKNNEAKWIGNPNASTNTDYLSAYTLSADFKAESGNKVGIVINARDKDNYVLIDVDMDNRLVKAYEYNDNAWSDGKPTVTARGKADGYVITTDAVARGKEYEQNSIKIQVNSNRSASIYINNIAIANSVSGFIPANPTNQPRRQYLMNIGFKQENSSAVYDNIKIESGDVYQSDDFSDNSGVLSALGEVTNGQLVVENEFNLINPCPSVNVRKVFTADESKTVQSARLYASAQGFYDAYINGEKVNDDFYNPGFTDYRKRIQYQTYDVTDKIQQGQNVIGATVAKGYYTGWVGYATSPMVYGSKNTFIGKLVINYTDGTTDILVTDDTWQFTDKGAVVCGDYQQGESYDARLELDWNDTEDARWIDCGSQVWPSSVKPTNGSLKGEKFELSAQSSPTAKVERTLVPVSVKEYPTGHFVYDFGQNMVGTVRLKVKGKKGQSIKLRYGEMCHADGTLYISNLRTAANTDTYTFKGEADGETFTPSFTSHGFRYVEVTGNGCTIDSIDDLIISIEGLVITNTTDETGAFECSNDDINQLYSNIMWGQRGNSLLVYTDCPQRNERMGWTGDGQVFAKTAAYNMDVKSFMEKWLRDMRDGQLLYNKNGAVPDTAPLGGDNRSDGCAGWGDAAVIIPWEMYRAYGDISVLEDNYNMMKKWVEYQSRADRQNYGIRTVNGVEVPKQSDLATIPYIQVQQRRGDHLTYDESTPFILSATAYAARVSEILADTAEILGKADDEAKYRERYENIKQAFNEAWVQDDGSIAYWGEMSKSNKDKNGNIINQTYYSNTDESNATPSQTAYALAIDFGLIPQEKMAHTAECFQKSIDEQNGKLSVGFLGISHLTPALTKAGLTDTAFALLEQTENPSWLYSVKNGATTIWERWNSYIAETDTFGDVSMNSFNHYSYGAIGEWMFSDILGINADEVGYKSIVLKPTVGGNLTYAKGSYESAYGEIDSEWSIDNQILTYKCTVPANTTATLYLPTNNAENILESGNNIENAIGVTYKGTENEKAVFALESGKYEFVSEVNGNTNETYWLTINTPSGSKKTAKINGKETVLPTALSVAAGATVTVEAEDSDEPLKFANWSGDIESTDKKISFTMNQTKTLQANYSYTAPSTEDKKAVLNLTSNVNGATVKINEEIYSLPCNIEYEKGTEVELELIVPNGYKFVSWNGDNLGAANVKVLMNGNVTSKAVFKRVLTGKKTTVNIANPEKISAHAVIGGEDYPLPITNEEIAVEYLEDITIVSDDENYAFAYWSGDVVSSNNPIKSELPENPNLSVHFAYVGGNSVSDTVTLSVTGDDGGVYINGKEYSLPFCDKFAKGTQIIMLAKAPDGKLFKSWTNDKLLGSASILTLNDDFETGIEFETAIKKEIASIGKNVTSNNSLENGDWSKNKLTDGVTIGGGYTSNKFGNVDVESDSPYFEIDLSSNTEISRVILYPRTDTSALAAGYYQFPQDFKVEVKADGGDYIQVYSVEGAEDKSEPYIIDFNTMSARYVKVTATKLSSNQIKNGGIRFQLAECEVYKNDGELQKVENISITDDGITDENDLRAEVMPESADMKNVMWFILDENGLNSDAEIVNNRLIVLKQDSTASIGAYAEDNGGAFALRALNKREEPTQTEYFVTYYKNDGTIENEDDYTSYTYGMGLTLPIPQRNGYTFGGWYDNESCIGDAVEKISATATGDKTYYAKWIKTIDVSDKFSDELTIEKVADESSIKLVVSPKNGNRLPSMRLYSAIYKEDKSLKRVNAEKYDVNEDGNIIIPLSEPQLENGESYKLMLWDDNQIPVISAISSDVSDFFRK